MLQLPDNCAIFTFWDSFTLLKAGENIKTIELPRRVESCLYAGIARRTGGWSAKDAYINKTTLSGLASCHSGLRLVHGHHATESHVEDMQLHGDVLVDARAHIHAVGTPVGYDDAVRVLVARIRRHDGDHARDVDRPRDGHRHNNRRGRAEVVKHDLRGLHDGLGYRMLREGKHRRDVACVRREVDAVI